MTHVAGYDEAQIANAAIIASVAAAWGMGERGALLGVMCAMGESSLRNIDYGDWETNGVRNPDGTPTTSIGLFQQQASWGSIPDRMDPIYSSWKFFEALKRISGWRGLEPTVAIHRVQINADPNHYAKYESVARAVLDAIPDLRAKGVIMADPMEVIEVPWQPGNYARRALVDAVSRAGKPRGNSWGRLKDEQQRAWDKYQNGTGSPADDPSRPNSFPLAHVRFVAVDVDATANNVRNLLAQGLVRPYDYEPWHFQLPGSVYKWPLVDSIPRTSASDAKPFPPQEEDEEEMASAPIIVGRDTDGSVFSIPMGGKVWQFPDEATYRRHSNTLKVLSDNGWPVAVTPDLAKIVFVSQERLNDLILAQGAYS